MYLIQQCVSQSKDIVIGIEQFDGTTKFSYNRNVIVDNGHFVSTFMGAVNNMIFAGIGKPTIIEDWVVKHGQIYMPGLDNFSLFNKWKFEPWSYTKNLTREAIFWGLKMAEGQWVNTPMKQLVKDIDPKIAMVFNGNGSMKAYLKGLESYGNVESKTIRFSQSGGITISVGGFPMGYMPEIFHIESAHIFGAVKYGGKWRGIRFSHN